MDDCSLSGEVAVLRMAGVCVEQVVKECTEAKEWLADKVAQQAALPKTSPPAVLTKEMIARKETIERFCKPIMSKPKPAPKPEEKAAEPEAKPAGE